MKKNHERVVCVECHGDLQAERKHDDRICRRRNCKMASAIGDDAFGPAAVRQKGIKVPQGNRKVQQAFLRGLRKPAAVPAAKLTFSSPAAAATPGALAQLAGLLGRVVGR